MLTSVVTGLNNLNVYNLDMNLTKNQKIIAAIGAGLVLILTITSIYFYTKSNSASNSSDNKTDVTPIPTSIATTIEPTQNEVSSSTLAPTISSSTPTAKPVTTFEDDRIKVIIPDGWTYKEVKVNNVKEGIVLLKGSYTLNILSHYPGQASGITGGRFSDIAGYMYAPELNIMQPGLECNSGASIGTKITGKLNRLDLFFNLEDFNSPSATEACGNPTVKDDLWYGSYLRTYLGVSDDGHFVDYLKMISNSTAQIEAKNEIVITMSYYSKDINKLPVKNSAELNTRIGEMTDIVKSIQWK
jgi:hypothetical protein